MIPDFLHCEAISILERCHDPRWSRYRYSFNGRDKGKITLWALIGIGKDHDWNAHIVRLSLYSLLVGDVQGFRRFDYRYLSLTLGTTHVTSIHLTNVDCERMKDADGSFIAQPPRCLLAIDEGRYFTTSLGDTEVTLCDWKFLPASTTTPITWLPSRISNRNQSMIAFCPAFSGANSWSDKKNSLFPITCSLDDSVFLPSRTAFNVFRSGRLAGGRASSCISTSPDLANTVILIKELLSPRLESHP
ncbi:uncharacterized protein ARMOST_15397 [Armillaria ostoyae]|uniref:Uncharacterized protein n=1 Tax=Armillaria ostoyae TaxID=47428 RepID=A0A284RT85_ARMOS|nr:uncharacterized protein ARMOST_15397 [Armillaria ostoyae]